MFDINTIVRKNILALKPYYSAKDEFTGPEGIFLDANENPFGTLNRYPDPQQKELKRKLSNYKDIPTENIFIGNGSDEIIDLTYRVFCTPQVDKALTISPSFGMYKVAAIVNDVELIQIPLTNKFQMDMPLIKSHLSDPNLNVVFLCSPNNPTGNSINWEDISYILENFKGIVVIDEAYIEFSTEDSWMTELKYYPNLVVLQTFSKAWGLASVRVGIAYASSEIVAFYNKVKMPYHVSGLNQNAAIQALENIDAFEVGKTIILAEREKLALELETANNVVKVYPTDANFFLVEFNDANLVYQYLIKQNIMTRNQNNVVKNCIRVTVGTPEENKSLINALNSMEK